MRILLIEDNEDDVLIIREMLAEVRNISFDIESVNRLSSAQVRLAMGGIDVILLDLGLPDSQGLDTLRKLYRDTSGVPVVVMTGRDDETLAQNAVQEGAQDYLVKGRLPGNALVRVILHAIGRKRIEEELRASRESFEAIVAKSADGILIVGLQGVVHFANPAAETLLSYRAEALLGNVFGLPMLADTFSEVDILRESGEMGIAEMHVVHTEWEGEPAYLALLRDITDRKRIEEELRASRESFQAIVAKSADGILVVGLQGMVHFANPAAETFLSYRTEDLLGSVLGLPVLADTFSEVDILCKSGEMGIAEMHVVNTEWEGKPAYLALLRDITERKRIELMKTDFVSLVSHQLKTPVAEIRGYVDNMLTGLTGDLTAKQKLYLQDMQEISARNYRLISDLLNVSRIDRGVISVEIKSVKLREIVELAVRDYRRSIKEKGVILNLEEVDNDIMVLADKEKMAEALSNVIHNAVKFTNEGSIAIKIRSESGFGIAEVVDTGKGMSDDLLSNLFTKDQILSGNPTPEGGAGLGLYIARQFMKLQHGDISATSSEGKGSRFVFKVSLANAEPRDLIGLG